MLGDLMAVGALAASLAGTAPVAVAAAGGADALVARYAFRAGEKFWSLGSLPEDLWERMAAESQEEHRGPPKEFDPA